MRDAATKMDEFFVEIAKAGTPIAANVATKPATTFPD